MLSISNPTNRSQHREGQLDEAAIYGSRIFIDDLIESFQASLDLAHEAATEHHVFAIVKFDVTATFKFQINEQQSAQSEGPETDPSSSKKPKKPYRRLLALFSRNDATKNNTDSNQGKIDEQGEITVHLEFMPGKAASGRFDNTSDSGETPSTNVSSPFASPSDNTDVAPNGSGEQPATDMNSTGNSFGGRADTGGGENPFDNATVSNAPVTGNIFGANDGGDTPSNQNNEKSGSGSAGPDSQGTPADNPFSPA